eukprot:4018113-Amphidinium_carterae.1
MSMNTAICSFSGSALHGDVFSLCYVILLLRLMCYAQWQPREGEHNLNTQKNKHNTTKENLSSWPHCTWENPRPLSNALARGPQRGHPADAVSC